MSDLVGNPEDRFSRVAAHIKIFELFKFVTKLLGTKIPRKYYRLLIQRETLRNRHFSGAYIVWSQVTHKKDDKIQIRSH